MWERLTVVQWSPKPRHVPEISRMCAHDGKSQPGDHWEAKSPLCPLYRGISQVDRFQGQQKCRNTGIARLWLSPLFRINGKTKNPFQRHPWQGVGPSFRFRWRKTTSHSRHIAPLFCSPLLLLFISLPGKEASNEQSMRKELYQAHIVSEVYKTVRDCYILAQNQACETQTRAT